MLSATPLLSRKRPALMTLATYLTFWLAVASQGSSLSMKQVFFRIQNIRKNVPYHSLSLKILSRTFGMMKS
jgi:hypothetical protein